MGLFSRILGLTATYHLKGCSIGAIKLPKPVRTPLGSNVRSIHCVVDLDYQITVKTFKIKRARLGMSSIGDGFFNVRASQTGEVWKADDGLHGYLNDKIIPRVVDQLVRQDARLQEWMRENAGIFADATEKQKALASRLGIPVRNGTNKCEMHDLISEKLYSATYKQRAFAKRLGIPFDDGISKRDIGELIDQKLKKKRKR